MLFLNYRLRKFKLIKFKSLNLNLRTLLSFPRFQVNGRQEKHENTIKACFDNTLKIEKKKVDTIAPGNPPNGKYLQ